MNYSPNDDGSRVVYRPPTWRIPEREKAGWIVRANTPTHSTNLPSARGYYTPTSLAEDALHRSSPRQRVMPRRRRRTALRVWSVVSGIAAFLSFARVATLGLESWAAVRAERDADRRLLELCSSADAPTESPHMRAACLKARRDRASPLMFKAALRAVHTAWSEFSDAVGSPFKLGLLLLFLISGLAMPLMPALRLAGDAAAAVSSDALGLTITQDDSDDDNHVVVLQGGVPRAGCEG